MRVLVLNQEVSGMNKFLFRQLQKECSLDIRTIPYPKWPFYWNALKTFRPSRVQWKLRFRQRLNEYYISAGCFKARSAIAHQIATSSSADDQLVFQIGGLFDGLSRLQHRPTALFASFNTSLAYREWKPWAPFSSDAKFQAWFELEKSLYRSAAAILCTNRYVMRSFETDYGVDPHRLHYIGYGVNFDELPTFTKSYGSKIGLFVGYDFERKGGPAVVQAFRKLQTSIPDIRLRILGPDYLDPTYLGPGIEYIPRLKDRALVQNHFKEADFFVMPSVCEPFGLVFLEAMACQNACIGSYRNAMPEFIDHGRTGFLVEPGDIDSLAQYMGQLYRDRDFTASMGTAALERLRTEFTWDVCGARVRDIFQGLVRQRA